MPDDTAPAGRGLLAGSAPGRLVIAATAGTLVGVVVGWLLDAPLGILAGLTATYGFVVAAGWLALWPMDADHTRAHAGREDFRPSVEELLMVAVALGALIGIGVLVTVGTTHAKHLGALLALSSVFLAWGSLHLMYAGRYAYLYYRDEATPAIDFNSDRAPTYRDFFYFSYNLGMTFAVSDTNVNSAEVRSVVLRHCLLSYVFSGVILASTISLVAGIAIG